MNRNFIKSKIIPGNEAIRDNVKTCNYQFQKIINSHEAVREPVKECFNESDINSQSLLLFPVSRITWPISLKIFQKYIYNPFKTVNTQHLILYNTSTIL